MTEDDVFRGAEESGGGHHGLEEVSGLTSISEDELRARLKGLSEEKWTISYRRSEGGGDG